VKEQSFIGGTFTRSWAARNRAPAFELAFYQKLTRKHGHRIHAEMQDDETVRSNGKRMEIHSCIRPWCGSLRESQAFAHIDAIGWVSCRQSSKMEAGCQKYDTDPFSSSTISVRTESHPELRLNR
jgi:hypothetical protein